MPYRLVYEPAPSDDSLPILAELPQGIAEYPTLLRLREASGVLNGVFVHYHHCEHCGGWIEGNSNAFCVNTLNPQQLAGRQGTEYFCRRCGQEIAFMGMMS